MTPADDTPDTPENDAADTETATPDDTPVTSEVTPGSDSAATVAALQAHIETLKNELARVQTQNETKDRVIAEHVERQSELLSQSAQMGGQLEAMRLELERLKTPQIEAVKPDTFDVKPEPEPRGFWRRLFK